MKRNVILMLMILIQPFFRLTGQTSIIEDEVSGTWSRNNAPYIILKDINVPEGETLTIEPGVEIQFAASSGLTVEGSIEAIGSNTEQIKFTSVDSESVKQDSSLGWKGIIVLGNNPGTNIFENCVIEHVFNRSSEYRGGIFVQGREVSIKSCEIRHIYGEIIGGVYCVEESDVELINNEFHHCWSTFKSGTAIAISRSKAAILGNLIYKNRSGIRIAQLNQAEDTVLLYNNSIVDNGPNYEFTSALYVASSKVLAKNNVFWNNTGRYSYTAPIGTMSQIKINNGSYIKFENNIIESWDNSLTITSSTVEKENNIITEPIFANPQSANYTPLSNSSTINSGTGLETAISALLNEDINGNPRVYDDSQDIVDIGACEFQGIASNRPPAIFNPGLTHTLTSTPKEMTFQFSDPDIPDNHSLLVRTNNPNITVTGPATNTNNSAYTLMPTSNWSGNAEIILTATDNGGIQDIDTFLLVVSDTIRNDILCNTTWDKDTIFIDNSITVKNGAKLEINEGTNIVFLGHHSFTIEGEISAIGTAANKISFSASDTSGYSANTHTGWGGLNVQNVNSVFNNCIFEYVKDNITLDIGSNCSLDVINCIFRNNITQQNWQWSSVVKANEATVYLGNNLFYNNRCYYAPIFSEDSEIDIINNTICFNYGRSAGSIMTWASTGNIKNNIFWNNIGTDNMREVQTNYQTTNILIDKCIAKGGVNAIRNSNSNQPLGDIYGDYPLFVDTLNNDFRLLQNSVGINAGQNDPSLAKLGGIDLGGNSRIYNGASTIPDIGAYEYQGNPSNRAPVITTVNDQVIMIDNQLNMAVDFFDPDNIDTHTITISSDNNQVQIQNQSGNTPGTTYDLVPNAGYTGNAEITVIVTDNLGLADTVLYNVEVKSSTCGIITQDVIWDMDTVDVTCDVIVEEGTKLTIAPGTVVRFNGSYKLGVNGVIDAIGTETDTIKFLLHDSIEYSPSNYQNGWAGIEIKYTHENDTSKFAYCEITQSNVSGIYVYYANALIQHCNIHDNYSSSDVGAGISVRYDSYAKIENNFIHHNKIESGSGGGIACPYGAEVEIRNNVISNNLAFSSGGIYTNINKVIISGNTIENNQATGAQTGGLFCISNSLVENNLIRNNKSVKFGGGLSVSGNALIRNNRIENNICLNDAKNEGNGGGVYLSNDSSRLVNNLITGNKAYNGGAIYLNNSFAYITNNTICKDTSVLHGSALYLNASAPQIKNTIIYGNHDNVGIEDQVYINSGESFANFANCFIEKGKENIHPFLYNENIKLFDNIFQGEPNFSDFANNDFSLASSSLCVNNGVQDISGLSLPTVDLAGNPRIFDGDVDIIDIGAYELMDEPINRKPVLSYVPDIHLFSSQNKEMAIVFADPDDGNTHTLTIESDNPNLNINNVSGNVSGSTYDLAPMANWVGSAEIKVRVEDNFGLADSVYYSVNVSDSVCGKLLTNTTWDADTIFVKCNIEIPKDITLTIAPGTYVKFTGSYRLDVYGVLHASGNETDSISFSNGNEFNGNTNSNWSGIRFYNSTSLDSSKLKYCKILYGSNTVIENDKVAVSNSRFGYCNGYNGGAIKIYCAEPIIKENTFHNNTASMCGGAIAYIHDEEYWYSVKSPIVEKNIFLMNNARMGGSIFIDEQCGAQIKYNIIYNNKANEGGGMFVSYNNYFSNKEVFNFTNNLLYKNFATYSGGAIYSDNSKGEYINNTIVNNSSNNGGAIYFSGTIYAPFFYNSIIFGNVANETGPQIYINNDGVDPGFYYCNIQGGIKEIAGNGSGYNYTGRFENSIDSDPAFIDAESDNYHLSDTSVCVNSASINLPYGLQLPIVDLDGNPRAYASNASGVDMGAYEYQGDPENRKPLLLPIQDQYTFFGTAKTVHVEFTDVDKTDTHTITVVSNEPNVLVENQSGHVSGSTIDLIPANGWSGIAEIIVSVEDNHGKSAVDTFNLHVSDYFCGKIIQNTVWDQPIIRIACDVIIEEGTTLTINPGTEVIFDDGAGIKVFGTLIAEGTENNTITFTSADTTGYYFGSHAGWRGIRFYGPNSSTDTSKLIYCNIEYSRTIESENNDEEHGAGVFIKGWDGIIISNCIISHNIAYRLGGGIYCSGGLAEIKNNVISNNKAWGGGGLYLVNLWFREAQVVNNIISNNTGTPYGGGIYCNYMVSINNTIVNNYANYGGGIYCYSGPVTMLNSILWGNRAAIVHDQIEINYRGELHFYNSVLENGQAALPPLSIIDYEDMVETDPLFIAATEGTGASFNGAIADWSLQAISPCINTGNTTFPFTYLTTDMIGNPRIQMGTIDMGAYEFININPVTNGSISNQQIVAGIPFNLNLNHLVFEDANIGDELSYQLISSPVWLNYAINGQALELSGTAATNNIGNHTITLQASDLFNATASTSFTIEVIENASPTVVTEIEDKTLTPFEHLSIPEIDTYFADPNNQDQLNFSVRLANGNQLPEWLIFDNQTNLLSGDPVLADIGIYQLQVCANDLAGNQTCTTFDVEVAQNQPPVAINPIPDVDIRIPTNLDFNIDESSFTDNDWYDNLTYSAGLADGGNLPEWLTFDAETRTFSGSPIQSDAGVLNILVTVTDLAGNQVSSGFIINVIPNTVPIVSNPIVDKDENEGFSSMTINLATVFFDGDGDNLMFTATSGNTNIANVEIIGSNLLISEIGAGITSITVSANDGYGGVAQNIFNFAINSTTLVESIKEFGVKIYPNPVLDELFIEMPEISQNNCMVELTDLNGKRIFHTTQFNGKKTGINCGSLQSGVYILKISNNKEVKSCKIYKQD